MTTLIDPHLLVAPTTCPAVDEDSFWQRVVDVAAKGRVEIGHEAFHWVIAQLQHLGYPHARVDFGPPSFRRECQSAIEKILSRVSSGREEVEESNLSPEYLGSADARLCIVMDATEHGENLDGLMTDSNYWAPPGDSLSVGRRHIELLFDVDQVPRALAAEAIKSKFEARRLHVLGGSKTDSAIAHLKEELGLTDDAVNWITSEKSKPARDVDKRWAGLDPERDIAICITGRISHAVWEMGDKAAAKRGIKMIECASQGQLVDALKVWSSAQPRRNSTE